MIHALRHTGVGQRLQGEAAARPARASSSKRSAVNLMTGENRTGSFLALNPRGQVPVLVDGAVTVWDSQAILVYLARRYGEAWLPADPAPMAEVSGVQWLAVSENELLFGLARARAVLRFGRDFDPRLVPDIRPRRPERCWSSASPTTTGSPPAGPPSPTSPACPTPRFPTWEASPSTITRPVRAWIDRIRALPGFIAMEGSVSAGNRTAEQEGGRSSRVVASRPTRGLDAAVCFPPPEEPGQNRSPPRSRSLSNRPGVAASPARDRPRSPRSMMRWRVAPFALVEVERRLVQGATVLSQISTSPGRHLWLYWKHG